MSLKSLKFNVREQQYEMIRYICLLEKVSVRDFLKETVSVPAPVVVTDVELSTAEPAAEPPPPPLLLPPPSEGVSSAAAVQADEQV